MHEFSLMADLLGKIEQTAREQGVARVVSVTVQLGALSHITPEHFVEHFQRAIQGTVAEGARIEVEQASDVHDIHAQEILLRQIEVVPKTEG